VRPALGLAESSWRGAGGAAFALTLFCGPQDLPILTLKEVGKSGRDSGVLRVSRGTGPIPS